jgi:hypothetical protein
LESGAWFIELSNLVLQQEIIRFRPVLMVIAFCYAYSRSKMLIEKGAREILFHPIPTSFVIEIKV